MVSLFVWLLPLDLSGMGDPTNSYATAGIALRVLGVLKPHHHDKVGTILFNEVIPDFWGSFPRGKAAGT
jgi:hypothetical protein